MTRRGFIKSLLALSAARAVPIPRETLRAELDFAMLIPIGSIFQMFDAKNGLVHVMKTDHGFVELNGGVLSRQHFPELYRIIGTMYGTGHGDGASFTLPAFRAKAS